MVGCVCAVSVVTTEDCGERGDPTPVSSVLALGDSGPGLVGGDPTVPKLTGEEGEEMGEGTGWLISMVARERRVEMCFFVA